MVIGVYQGVAGAYSQLVIDHFLRQQGCEATTIGVPRYANVATTVSALRADIGVLPIENAIAGTVRECYDIVAEFGLVPVSEVLWHTDHRLLGIRGSELRDVREILAHPLVIAECGQFLASLPHARVIPCEDTGVAAREVARGGNPNIAALAPSVAAEIYGLAELAAHCADDPETFSRFLLVRSPNMAPGHRLAQREHDTPRKTSLVFSLADAPGKLAACLTEFGRRNINVHKLESKPRLGHGTEHVFYLDFDGDVQDPAVESALAAIQAEANAFSLLGSYEAHVGPPHRTPSVLQSVISAPELRAPQIISVHENTHIPRASRAARPQGSTFDIGGVRIGDGEFVIIAGPCSVESREQIMETARSVQSNGALMLRGGAFKPRTSPYAFQGLGWEGVSLLAEAGRATGLPTVSEVMTIDQVERLTGQIDVLQIGARNMQNFDLLKAVGRTGHPVLLKRGLSATIDDLLAAAEYILSEGNPNVMLCERGIRTFENATRNTLDLSAIPVLRERTHLPVFVDPSHAVGVRRWIRPLCRAAKAVGAHGLLIEVHPNPAEAKCDKEQALTFGDFADIVEDLASIPLSHDARVNA
ncbi:MAG: 3-deoxy-7-phosphoheptulonate synthase [Vulcanimicrobiaceae bacterium]